MNKQVFVDTDVILDLLCRRHPFYDAAATLFTLAENDRYRFVSTPLAFANIFYILRKQTGYETASLLLRKLRILVGVADMTSKTLDMALNSKMTDFEDALQYFSAVSFSVDYFITRNKKDYTEKGLSALTPDEFLAMLPGMAD